MIDYDPNQDDDLPLLRAFAGIAGASVAGQLLIDLADRLFRERSMNDGFQRTIKCALESLGCTIRDDSFRDDCTMAIGDLENQIKALKATLRRVQRIGAKLAAWDMLTLDADGHGTATSDAPWARGWIAELLDDCDQALEA
jgi:hypothetical protein